MNILSIVGIVIAIFGLSLRYLMDQHCIKRNNFTGLQQYTYKIIFYKLLYQVLCAGLVLYGVYTFLSGISTF